MSETNEMAAGGSSGVTPHLSDVRIVLLGNRFAGKISAGNIILGREEFDPDVKTLQCVKRQGEVAGRHVTVVDSPGWTDYDHIFLIDSCNLIKQEIGLSVTQCSPGPHAVLLVIHENIVFQEVEKITTSNHLDLLGHEVWKHTLVLFIQETPAEEKAFEVKGKMLQWLVEKCGHRYHVFNTNIKSSDDTQVKELLEKIENMVARNNGLHYELDRKRLKKMEDRRKTEEERAQERRREIQKQRESLRSSSGAQFLSEISIVLLGCKGSGKSSSGNTILGREEFQPGQRSAVCVKRQGEVAGRQLTLVEAPGWWDYYSVRSSSEMTRREIVLSQGLCGEGPHCFFVVLRADTSFPEAHRVSVEQHTALLGEGVWRHTMVLFTHADWLGDTTIEQHIESEGEGLKWLIEKCSNRYHVLNNHQKEDKDQVKELLEKIEEMVAGNADGQFLMDRKRVQEVLEWKEAVDERAKERVMKMSKRNDPLGPSSGLQPLSVVLLGIKYHGSTASGNTILGREELELRRTDESVMRRGELAGREITVVDTPGWWRNSFLKDTPELIKQEIVLSMSLCPPGPHAVLLVICLEICFTETDRIIVKEHMELLGEDVWNHTIVLFTYGDWMGGTTIEKYIESEGESLKWIIEKCGNRYHIFDNRKRDENFQCTQLLEKIEEMVAGNGGRHFEVDKNILLEVERKRNHLSTRAANRGTKAYKQHAVFKYVTGDIQPLFEMRLMLLYHAKNATSAEGSWSNREESSEGLTFQRQRDHWNIEGRKVTTIYVEMLQSKSTLEETKAEFVSSLSKCHPGPHAFVLVVSTDLHFTVGTLREFQTHLEPLGDRVWGYAIMCFHSPGDLLADKTIEEYIESEGKALQWLVWKCGNRYVHWTDSENTTDLLKKIEEMVVLNGGSHFQYEEGRTHETKVTDWKNEMQQLVEVEESDLMISGSRAGKDDRSEVTSVTSDSHTHVVDTGSEILSDSGISAAHSIHVPPEMGGDDRSDLTSLSFRKPTSACEAHSEHDSGISTAKSSTDLHQFGGDDKSDITEPSSGKRKHILHTASEASSEQDSKSMMPPHKLAKMTGQN